MNEPLFKDQYNKDIWGIAYKATKELEDRIGNLNLFAWPPKPWSDEQFLKNPAEVHKRGYNVNAELIYSAIWAAQSHAALRKITPVVRNQLTVQIDDSIMKCSLAIATLNLRLLDRVAVCLLNIGEARNISVVDALNDIISMKDLLKIGNLALVRNVVWLDLFAWHIPTLAPEQTERSLAIGRCHWSLFNLENIAKDEFTNESAENIWGNRIRMIALAQFLQFPL